MVGFEIGVTDCSHDRWSGRDRGSATFSRMAVECVALARRTIDLDSRIALLTIAQKWIAIANNRVGVDASLHE
jgi:hypothetical protein